VTKAFDIFAIWRGYPAEIRVDNGTKINFHHTIAWAEKQIVKIKYIQPGKPAENGFIEYFDRTD
jgi:putative transposase